MNLGRKMKLKKKENKNKMKKNWHPEDGFQRIIDDMIYASFAGKPIKPEDVGNRPDTIPKEYILILSLVP